MSEYQVTDNVTGQPVRLPCRECGNNPCVYPCGNMTPIEWAVPRIALLAKGYDDEQHFWIAQTALLNPGVPVVFDGHGGREQITRVGAGWEIRGAK